MRCLRGKSVCKGIVCGSIAVLKKKEAVVKREHITEIQREVDRVTAARERSKQQLADLYEKAVKEVGTSSAAVFEVHQMLLEDEDYCGFIETMIRTQQVNAEYAVVAARDHFCRIFAEMEDEYMRARAADVHDISKRLLYNLYGSSIELQEFDHPVIVAAEDLSPSETIHLGKEKILAFVTVHGSVNSHTAILARMMGIPALVGVEHLDLECLEDGTQAVVDGVRGELILDPDGQMKAAARQRMEQEREKRELLLQLKGKDNVTRSGKKIRICANIGSVSELEAVLENDAGGIGLFRSEFLYLGRGELPSEEEQFQVYRQAAEAMNGKKVIIRTLDIGADKQVEYLRFDKEENPVLGYRAIRICLDRPDIFRTQLRAILRASVYGNVSVMYPMITSEEEIHKIRIIMQEAKHELKMEQIPYCDIEEGIMIETPAAALISDRLAVLVDFFSIGTNDLTQYALAIDRKNDKLESFYNPHHEAILRMIRMTVENGHQAGKWVGICGELGADVSLTEAFIQMGVDELSVVPSMVLKLRKTVRELA